MYRRNGFHKRWRKIGLSWSDSLSESETTILRAFFGGSYTEINTRIRAWLYGIAALTNQVCDVLAIGLTAPICPGIWYRGVNLHSDTKIDIGNVVVWSQLSSITADYDFAAKWENTSNNHHVFVIKTTSARLVNFASHFSYENSYEPSPERIDGESEAWQYPCKLQITGIERDTYYDTTVVYCSVIEELSLCQGGIVQ